MCVHCCSSCVAQLVDVCLLTWHSSCCLGASLLSSAAYKPACYHYDVCSFENWFRWRHISTVEITSAYLVKTKVKMHLDHICCQWSDSKWHHLCSKEHLWLCVCQHQLKWMSVLSCRFHPKVCVLDFICVCRYQQLCRKQMFLETWMPQCWRASTGWETEQI